MTDRTIINSAQQALGRLFDRIPNNAQDEIVNDVMTVQRAMFLLSRAIDFKDQIDAKVYHFGKDIERAMES